MGSMTVEVELAQISCGCCGGTYAINERFRKKCHEDGTGWTCPYCKTSWGYFNNNENAQLKKQLAEKEAAIARERAAHDQTKTELRETEQRRRAEKGAKTRLKRRAAHGVCPCCKRQFSELKKHIAQMHPDFIKEANDEAAAETT